MQFYIDIGYWILDMRVSNINQVLLKIKPSKGSNIEENIYDVETAITQWKKELGL